MPGGKVISTILRIKRHSCYQINYLMPHWTVTKKTRRRMTFIYAPSYPSPSNNHIFLRPSKKRPLKKPSSYVWWGNTILLTLKPLCAPPILFQCQNKRQRNPYINKNKQGLIFFLPLGKVYCFVTVSLIRLKLGFSKSYNS